MVLSSLINVNKRTLMQIEHRSLIIILNFSLAHNDLFATQYATAASSCKSRPALISAFVWGTRISGGKPFNSMYSPL
jgi:hypothetical protein